MENVLCCLLVWFHDIIKVFLSELKSILLTFLLKIIPSWYFSVFFVRSLFHLRKFNSWIFFSTILLLDFFSYCLAHNCPAGFFFPHQCPTEFFFLRKCPAGIFFSSQVPGWIFFSSQVLGWIFFYFTSARLDFFSKMTSSPPPRSLMVHP